MSSRDEAHDWSHTLGNLEDLKMPVPVPGQPPKVGVTDAELELTEEGRQVLRFRQTSSRAKVLGWCNCIIAVYVFAAIPAIHFWYTGTVSFTENLSMAHVGFFGTMVAWHGALLGLEKMKNGGK